MKTIEKICPLCGKTFIPNPPSRKYCKDIHYRKCTVCGKAFELSTKNLNKTTCSYRCANLAGKEKREKTNLEKYGATNVFKSTEIQERIKQSNRDRYGVDWSFQSKEVKSKIRETLIERYGVDNPMKSPDLREKAQKTNLEKYGDISPFGKHSNIKHKIDENNLLKYGTIDPGNRPEAIQKRENTNLERYGAKYYKLSDTGKRVVEQTCLRKYGAKTPFESPIIQSKCKDTLELRYGVRNTMESEELKQRLSDSVQSKYGVPWPCMLPQCISANGVKNSKINQKFGDLLRENDIDFETEFPIERSSFDFRIQNSNILVEIDPSYSHTTKNTKFGGLDRHYHRNKSQLASKHGYRCIHVFDWDDWTKVVRLIRPITKRLYARSLDVREVSLEDCNEFLNSYHLQGSCKGQAIRYGLYQDNELIELMTFGKPRYNTNADLELLRLCIKPGYAVTGGSRRLIENSLKSLTVSRIVSYCDLSKFTGDVYNLLGFKAACLNPEPSLHWSKGHRQITDNLLRQRGYDQIFATNFGKGTSNIELMIEHNWLPVYDCGQQTYILTL